MSVSPVIYIVSLLLLHDCWANVVQTIGANISPAEREIPASGSRIGQNGRGDSERIEPKFKFAQIQHGRTNITVTAPSHLFDNNNLLFISLRSNDNSVRGYCIPLSPESGVVPGGGDSPVMRTAVEEYLPLANYCARLTCSCEKGVSCRVRPTRCPARYHRAGVDTEAWAKNMSVSAVQQPDTNSGGPAVSVTFVQRGHRFRELLVSHNGCVDATLHETEVQVPANQTHLLNCSLAYNRPILLRVAPGTRYCRKSNNCLHHYTYLPKMERPRKATPAPELAPAATPVLLTAGVPLLGVTVLVVAAAGLLWFRRTHGRALDSLPNNSAAYENDCFDHGSNGAAGCGSFAADCRTAAAGERAGASVLLLHLACSDAERAAVRQLAAELRARGAAVTDSAAPEWRRVARRDADAMPAALPAGGRVLLLSSPAVAAAVAAGGGPSEPERLVAAAVRQLAGSRLTADYGRLYQARLTADSPTVAGLVPGAVYTLPEHQHELVTALLAGTGSDTGIALTQTADTEGEQVTSGVAELTV